MTHEYTILTGGLVHATHASADSAPAEPLPSAIAWAAGIVLAVGSDDDVRAISRGDSRFADLGGAVVVPTSEPLEPGAPADFLILDGHPGPGGRATRVIALVRGGHAVEGEIPGLGPHD